MPTGIQSDAIGTPARFNEAQIAAIKGGIFGRPRPATNPAQTMAGVFGQAGAPHGRAQGAVGATTPQTGATRPPGASVRPTPTAGPTPAPNAPSGQQPAQNGGLGNLMPLLMLLGPIIAHLFGGGGMAQPGLTTPRGQGQI